MILIIYSSKEKACQNCQSKSLISLSFVFIQPTRFAYCITRIHVVALVKQSLMKSVALVCGVDEVMVMENLV